jgi:hypothetical protein
MQKGKECEGYWTKNARVGGHKTISLLLKKMSNKCFRNPCLPIRDVKANGNVNELYLTKYEQIGLKQKELDDEALMRQEEEELQRQAAMREKQRKMWTLNRRIRGE